MRKRYWVVLGFIGAVTGLWAWNSSLIAGPSSDSKLEFIAHRGLHQTFHREGLTNQTCTAERIFPPNHDYIENTPESTNAATEMGADIVEIDIAPTMDNKLAVFHDWTLDCRTNGTGPIRDKMMADLRQLDVGYGYTADEGKTFPFRGKLLCLLLTIRQVFLKFFAILPRIKISQIPLRHHPKLLREIFITHASVFHLASIWRKPYHMRLACQDRIAPQRSTIP